MVTLVFVFNTCYYFINNWGNYVIKVHNLEVLLMYEYEFVKVNTKSSNRHYYDVVGNYAKSGWRLHQVLNNQLAKEGSCVELIFEREIN